MAGDRQDYAGCEAACTCPECLDLPKEERRLERQSRAAECGCLICTEYLLSL